MAIPKCLPCNPCAPGNVSNDVFKQNVQLILCAIQEATQDTNIITTEILCDPVTGAPILLVIREDTAQGEPNQILAYNIADPLTPYIGVIADLIACGTGGTASEVNLTGINGVAPSVGNGATDTGTLRVTLSNDSTGQVRLAAGAAIIGSLAANQSVNVAQLAGTATSTGAGAVDAGTLRVTPASGSSIGTTTNVTQWNGNTVSLNAGASDAGTLRTVLASGINYTIDNVLIGGNAIAVGAGVASTGTQRVVLAPSTDINNPVKPEDQASNNGDALMCIAGVARSATPSTSVGAYGDYMTPAFNDYGAQFVALTYRYQETPGDSPVRAEDAAFGSSNAVMVAGSMRSDTLASTTDANNDVQQLKTDSIGRLWVSGSFAEDVAHTNGDVGIFTLGVSATTPASFGASGDYTPICTTVSGVTYTEPSNQVATYAASTTSGSGGGITTTGASVLTNSAKAKIITAVNTTDVIVQLSPDAGTTWPYTMAANGGAIAVDLGTNGRWTASNIHARSITSNSSSGALYLGLTI